MKKKKLIYLSLASVVMVFFATRLFFLSRYADGAQYSTPGVAPSTSPEGSTPPGLASHAGEAGKTTPPMTARDYSQLAHRLADMQARHRGRTFNAQAVADAAARKSAWRVIDKVPASLPLKPKERADGRQFIRFDPLKLESLMPGDVLEIVLVRHGPEYRVHIDSVEVHDNGRVTWNGHLLGQGDIYRATFTRGEFLTLGGINTPQGHYTLQSHGELGWIASSRTLARHAPHADPLVPPRGTAINSSL